MKKVVLLVLLCTFAVLLAAGCSAGAPQEASAPEPAADIAVPEAAMDAGEALDSAVSSEEYSAAEESGAGLGDLPNINVPDTSRKLVYTSSFTIDSRQFDTDYAAIKTALSTVGGYIESENTYSNDTEYGPSRYSTMVLRVPVAQYNGFLDTLSGIGSVADKQVGTQDISDQYFDTESRIEILEMQRGRLLGYLKTATDMDDIIALEDELSDVLYELDQYKGSRRQMDDMVNFSSVSVSLNELLTPQNMQPEKSEPASQRASNAFTISMANVGLFLQNVGIFFAAAAPVLLLIAVIVVAILLIRKLVLYLVKKNRKPKTGA